MLLKSYNSKLYTVCLADFFLPGLVGGLTFNQDFCSTPQFVMGKALYIAVLCAQDELCEFVLNLGSVLSVQLEYCARIRN